MEIYQVGGAVRDKLLELPVKDRDWVVVGATPEAMLDLGYQQVDDLKNDAVKIQKEIDKFELKITKNSMEGGALYGSLTIKEIIQNLETHNFKNISANMIELKEQIKRIGDYVVIINLHADVQASIKVKVVSVEKIV